ncbi:MAG: iron-containing alcohol dehydrogenase [Anaerolineales bacterium]|jgi:alcohol dehydrogenase class IV
MQFEFATAAKIIFGAGKINSIGTLIEDYGNRVLIITGAPQSISEKLLNLLNLSEANHCLIKIDNEPTVAVVREVVERARKISTNLVIGIGGGSALDTSKATAALLTNPGDVTDYLEVAGLNKPLIHPSLPLIAIPTTSGTGSEVTRNAVIGSPLHHVKVSLRSHHLLPRIALIDPELTISVPPCITASTGLDALTQLIEPFTSNSPNPLTDALCLEGIRRVAHSLSQAYDHGKDLHAREDMSMASLFSGLALANAKLGAVHGLAGPIGGQIPAPHGAICASLLPHVMAANISALTNRYPDHPALERYAMVGRLLSGNPDANAETAIQWVQNFCLHAKIQSLSTFGLTESHFSTIIEKSLKASSMKGNPITLTENELRNILQRSL